MPDIKTKVSLYFPKDLFKKFEKLRTEKEERLGVTISKNEYALKLIKDGISDVEKKDQFGIAELSPEYCATKDEMQDVKDDLKTLRAEVEKMKEDKS